jgi:hypothetical protein
MKKLLLPLAALLLTVSISAAAPASDASVKELLAATEVHKMLDNMWPQMDKLMDASMAQATSDHQLTPEAQKIADGMRVKMREIMKQELNWETLEPMYVNIYKESFTQEEVNGLLAFYKSPAGVAMVKKMPLVMQKSFGAMQQKMGPLMQKIQAAAQEGAQEIAKAQAKSSTNSKAEEPKE